MKPLPLTFTKNGFLFTQRWREGNIAIYGKRRANWKEGVETFEVIRIRPMKGGLAFGKLIEPYEAYPGSEEWGVLGWAYGVFSRAEEQAATLIPSKSPNGGTCTKVTLLDKPETPP